MADKSHPFCRPEDECPCHLAAAGTCPVCSLWRGEDFCDCNWAGICVYDQYRWKKGLARPDRQAGDRPA